jgi:OOP family OmpA-OmpF porin
MTRANRHVLPGWIAAAALVMGGLAPAAWAQEGAAELEPTIELTPWDFGLFGGYHFTSETNELGVADVENPDAFDDSWGLGFRFGYAFMPFLSAEGEVAFLPTDTIRTETDTMPIGARVHALAHFLGPESRFRPFAVGGFGALISSATNIDVLDHDADLLFHAGVGFKLGIGEQWGLRVDGRIMFPPSTEDEGPTTDFEIWAGFAYQFGRETAPEPEPEPEPQPPADTDGDGILDDSDQCPSEPEDMDGFQDEDGCPDPDNDGDGIPDAQDQCPNEAEDMDGFEDTDGCPDPDNDGDGIPDAQDQCPTEPETKNGFEDDDGCPDEVPVAVKKFSGTIKGITFKVNSAVILPKSFATLDEAVKVLTEYPSISLEIQGHTDSQGPDEYNLKLSQDRADSVKSYLVSKGLEDTRLTARGYGETTPIADNKTAAGRQENRRVEFKRIGDESGGAPATQPSTTPAPKPVEAPKTTPAPAPEGEGEGE